jgi:hypothetical protein
MRSQRNLVSAAWVQTTRHVWTGVDAKSTYRYLLAAEQRRGADTRGVQLLDATEQALNLLQALAVTGGDTLRVIDSTIVQVQPPVSGQREPLRLSGQSGRPEGGGRSVFRLSARALSRSAAPLSGAPQRAAPNASKRALSRANPRGRGRVGE